MLTPESFNFKDSPKKYGYISYIKQILEHRIYFEGEHTLTFMYVIECYKRI